MWPWSMDPLELELGEIVNSHVGAGFRSGSTGRAASPLHFWAISQAPLQRLVSIESHHLQIGIV